jgi:hypothetical protein
LALTIASNILPAGRRRRLLLGGVVLALAVAATAALVLADVPRGARVGLFLPFWAAALGVLQARHHT